MSGKAKRNIYYILSVVLWVGAIAGAVLLYLFTAPFPAGIAEYWVIAVVLVVALWIPAVVHEIGHLLFGWLVGMKFVGVTFCYLRISRGKVRFVNPNYAGETEMTPKSGKRIRSRTFVFTLGGSLFCLILGGIFLAVYLALPYHAGWLFGGMMGILLLLEGLLALYPVELPAGKTDGAVLLGLLRHAPEEEIMLRVLTAQGILYRGGNSDIERDLLFSVPVVREDLPAYHALLLLQINYLKEMGEKAEAERKLEQLRSLREYLTDEERETLDAFVI